MSEELDPSVPPEDAVFVEYAKDAYRASTDYFDANIRKQLEKNISMFRSKHPAGSKYWSEAYRHRSKLFRPKTRSSVKRSMAAASVAFFSTHDVVTVSAEDKRDPTQLASAAVYNELLNMRLTRTIPWFLTCMGAFQDADINGLCISKQHWQYETNRKAVMVPVVDPLTQQPMVDPETGRPVMEKQEDVEVVKDRPWIDLIPVENFRFDPAADWRNPVETSPYLIHLVPMYIGDVMGRMKKGEWRHYDQGEIEASQRSLTNDSLRQAREGNRTDSHDVSYGNSLFSLVWCHENIIRIDGQDMVYWTLGTDKLLTDPKPLREVYHHGIRPFSVGFSEIETHKTYPSGTPEQGEALQVEANNIVNQRIDNIQLILNRRWKVRRGSDVDTRMLKTSIPGGLIAMSNLDDVAPEQMPDVTSSSYHEQDRINADFDDLVGGFSSGTVSTARNLNETVGGMSMLEGAANAMIEFKIRVFAETWVEPVMRQMLMLEKAYESDEVMLAVAGEQAQIAHKFGIDQVTDDLLMQSVMTQVNVGHGATNPQQRIDNLAYGMRAIAEIAPHVMANVNAEEIVAEIMGGLGHKDGARFFHADDEDGQQIPPEVQEQIQMLEQQLAEAQQRAQGHEIRAQAQIEGKQIDAQARLQAEEMRAMLKQQEIGTRAETDMMKMRNQIKLEHVRGRYRQLIEATRNELDAVDKQLDSARVDLERGKLELQRQALLEKFNQQEQQLRGELRALDPGRKVDRGPIGPDTNSLKGVIQRDQYGQIPDSIG